MHIFYALIIQNAQLTLMNTNENTEMFLLFSYFNQKDIILYFIHYNNNTRLILLNSLYSINIAILNGNIYIYIISIVNWDQFTDFYGYFSIQSYYSQFIHFTTSYYKNY